MAKIEKDTTVDFLGADVNRLHKRSDLDSSKQSQHHTLGLRDTQAASGAHTHDGYNSSQITTPQLMLSGVTLNGSKGGNAALASVIAALVLLGATDSTT